MIRGSRPMYGCGAAVAGMRIGFGRRRSPRRSGSIAMGSYVRAMLSERRGVRGPVAGRRRWAWPGSPSPPGACWLQRRAVLPAGATPFAGRPARCGIRGRAAGPVGEKLVPPRVRPGRLASRPAPRLGLPGGHAARRTRRTGVTPGGSSRPRATRGAGGRSCAQSAGHRPEALLRAQQRHHGPPPGLGAVPPAAPVGSLTATASCLPDASRRQHPVGWQGRSPLPQGVAHRRAAGAGRDGSMPKAPGRSPVRKWRHVQHSRGGGANPLQVWGCLPGRRPCPRAPSGVPDPPGSGAGAPTARFAPDRPPVSGDAGTCHQPLRAGSGAHGEGRRYRDGSFRLPIPILSSSSQSGWSAIAGAR